MNTCLVSNADLGFSALNVIQMSRLTWDCVKLHNTIIFSLNEIAERIMSQFTIVVAHISQKRPNWLLKDPRLISMPCIKRFPTLAQPWIGLGTACVSYIFILVF